LVNRESTKSGSYALGFWVRRDIRWAQERDRKRQRLHLSREIVQRHNEAICVNHPFGVTDHGAHHPNAQGIQQRRWGLKSARCITIARRNYNLKFRAYSLEGGTTLHLRRPCRAAENYPAACSVTVRAPKAA